MDVVGGEKDPSAPNGMKSFLQLPTWSRPYREVCRNVRKEEMRVERKWEERRSVIIWKLCEEEYEKEESKPHIAQVSV